LIPLQVQLVAIPPKVWNSWPPDRQLVHLANDALGIERRIQKGVDVVKERVRYRQLCDWIEAKALEAGQGLGGKAWRFETDAKSGQPSANDYMRLVELLASSQMARQTFAAQRAKTSSATKVSREIVGKTVYPPGAAVTEQRQLFEQLASGLVDKLFPQVAGSERKAWAEAAKFKAAAYREAEAMRAGMIEVVAPGTRALPSGDPKVVGRKSGVSSR